MIQKHFYQAEHVIYQWLGRLSKVRFGIFAAGLGIVITFTLFVALKSALTIPLRAPSELTFVNSELKKLKILTRHVRQYAQERKSGTTSESTGRSFDDALRSVQRLASQHALIVSEVRSDDRDRHLRETSLIRASMKGAFKDARLFLRDFLERDRSYRVYRLVLRRPSNVPQIEMILELEKQPVK